MILIKGDWRKLDTESKELIQEAEEIAEATLTPETEKKEQDKQDYQTEWEKDYYIDNDIEDLETIEIGS